ncbi:MAG TPA: transglycosylase SLT domain-containing protein [Usitatibacter sp.]
MALICIKTVWRTMCACLAIAALHAAAAASDSDILAAKDAAVRGQWRVLESYRAKLAGTLLEAYPSYWLLSGNIERADAKEVQAFLERYPDSPLSEGLRRDWLRYLGSIGGWDLFRSEYPKVTGEELEITCYSFQERLARGDPEAMPEARGLFVSGREAPAACDPVFTRAVTEKVITEAQIWDRIRVLLAAGSVKDAKRANALLSRRAAIVERSLDAANSDAKRFFTHEKLGAHPSRDGQELLLFAVERLARGKPEEAADRMEQVAPRLPIDAVKYGWGQVAYWGALAHQSRALDWYAQSDPAILTDAQLAWQVRAAIRAGAWKQTLSSIQALSPQEAREPTWRYWRARALRSLGETEAANGLLKTVASQPTFYGLLAADELGIVVTPQWDGYRPTQEDLARVNALPGIQRALELYRVDLDNEAFREWIWAIRGLDDKGLLAAAEIARAANEPDRAINTAEKTLQLHDFAQRFPIPHHDALATAARQWDMDEALVYGIIRQESRFMPEAKSRAGATGLMQLMPSTARWVARQMSVAYRPGMLVVPETNLQMGTYYFKRVLDDLGSPVLATAAYNAGPGRARRWRDERPMESAVYIETIPFNETRDYVKKVLTNAWYYRHRLTGKSVSLRELMGTIPGSVGEPAVAAAASNIP